MRKSMLYRPPRTTVTDEEVRQIMGKGRIIAGLWVLFIAAVLLTTGVLPIGH
jgi:hypothetical protein